MIRPPFQAHDFNDFYDTVTRLQDDAHGGRYTEHHTALTDFACECDSVMEIGVCQGASLAAMMKYVNRPGRVIGVDIRDKHFRPHQHHFEEYARQHDIDFEFIVADSTAGPIAEVDMLHIDSLHTPEHLLKELKIHAPLVKKYLAFHDTSNYTGCEGLLETIAHYITYVEQSWRIVRHDIDICGFTVIERYEREPLKLTKLKDRKY